MAKDLWGRFKKDLNWWFDLIGKSENWH
jgi:hypothetical protein